MANNIKFNVGFSVDKTGLNEMQSLFQIITNKAKEPGNQLNKGLQQAGQTASILDGILEKTFNTNLGTLNVTKFNQELSKSNLTLKDVQTNLSKAGNNGITAYNKLAQSILGTNQQIKQTNQILDKMAVTFKNTIRYGISSSIFNNMAGAIEKAYSYSRDLDKSLNDIRIVTDQSADNMNRFAEEANSAAKNLGANTLDYTNAALIYYQQGLSDAEVRARAETTIKAANVTGQRGEEVSEQLTAVWNGYKVTAEETESYVDKLAAVAATTAADLEELSVGMSKVASAANAMGVDFDDLNAQIATIVSVTRQAPESVGTALKTIYARLGDLQVDGVDEFGVSLGKVGEQMAQMGIQILDQQGNLRDMSSIIAEVAEKWDGWTQAQRQAAAVAMAGKRQYNNLIALFDNWDMYTDALNTSVEAVGTLQHQQDIYMESTEAKLKTLKATWQDLYGDLIDQDELNSGIELLTNFVQTFDNFIESFGGGLKSITGFGTIVASIFNKQIAESINGAIQRAEVFKNNLNLSKANAEIRRLGAGQLEENATAQQLATQANTEIQLEYAQKIYDARLGLNQEQANTLINYQQEIGKLEEENVLAQKQIEFIQQRNHFTEEEILKLEQEKTNTLEITTDYYERVEAAKNELNNSKDLLEIYRQEGIEVEDLVSLKERLITLGSKLNEEGQQDLNNLIKRIETTELDNKLEEDILETLTQIYEANQENLQVEEQKYRAAQQLADVYNKQAKSQEQQNNIKQQAEGLLTMSRNASTVTQQVTVLTSALGNMAMAWSSINSLVQIWNNDSLSGAEKFTQTLMTLGMAIPLIISNFSKLNETLGFTSIVLPKLKQFFTSLIAVEEIENATKTKTLAQGELELLQSQKRISVLELESLARKKLGVETQLAYAEGTEAIVLNMQAEALATQIKEKAITVEEQKLAIDQLITKGLEEQTVGQTTLNGAMAANPIGIIILALTAVVGVLAAAHSKYQQMIKDHQELATSAAEAASSLEGESQSHKELINQYEELKESYDKGEASKKELREISLKLIDAYGLEGERINLLIEDYDSLTEAIRRKREEEEKELLKKDVEAIQTEKQTLEDESKKATFGKTTKDEYILDLGQSPSASYDLVNNEDVRKSFEEVFGKEALNKQKISFEKSASGYIDFYNKVVTLQEKLTQVGEETSGTFTALEDTLESFNENGSIDELISKQDKYINHLLDTVHFEETISEEDYLKKTEEAKQLLTEAIERGEIANSEDVNKRVEDYISVIDNDFIRAAEKVENFKEKVKLSDKDFESLMNELSESDKKLLFSGEIEFDGLKTKEDIQKALEIAKNQLTDEDLTIVASLRTKISSDKKLTKKELEEKAGEESTLMQDYDTELSDFDNQSELDQVDILNNIVNQKIEANQRYITNAKEVAEEEKEILEERKENLETELENLQNKQMAPGVELTDEEKERYDELINDILPALEDKISEVQEVAENGLGFDEINEINFDNLITGIDGVITEADVLKDLAEEIGENWTIAAGDIEEVALNFPELLQAQENYNTLQDGSVQLTEQGRVALQGLVAERKNQLIAENEAYQIELQKQADLQYAAADYYAQQAQYIQDYLNNQSSAAEAEQNMKKAVKDYENKVIEITAGNDKKAKQAMSTNLAAVTSNAQTNLKNQYDMWCSVGEAIAAAAMAETSGQFTPPGFNGAGGVSTSLTDMQSEALPSSNDSIFSSKAAAQTAYQNLKKREAEARNQGDQLLAKKAVAQSGTNAALNAMNNAASGKGGKGSSSKGGKGKKGGGGKGSEKEKEKKEFEDKIDRYYDLNRAIEKTSRTMERFAKIKENLSGKNLTKALEKETKLLRKQRQNYSALIKEEKKEAREEQKKLRGTFGLKFNKDGSIKNYADVANNEWKRMKDATDKYNNSKQTDKDKKEYEKAKARWDLLKNETKNYTDLWDKIYDDLDKKEELRLETIKRNFEAFDNKLKVKIDKREFRRDARELINTLNEDIQSVFKDYSIELDFNSDIFRSKNKDFSDIINQINKTKKSIDKIEAGGKSKNFDTIDKAQDYLKELYSQLSDTIGDMKQAYEKAWSAYLDEIEQAADKFDLIQDKFDKINDELEYQKQLIELIYGENAYDLMDNFYQAQHEVTLNRITSLRTESQMWNKQLNDRLEETGHSLENMFEWDEDEKKYYENWQNAQSKMKDEVINDIKIIQDKYLNSVNEILQNIEKSITGGILLEDVETQWKRISENAEKYYDSVEKTYQIQTLSNKMEKDIVATSNLKVQQKLQKLKEKELKELREKDKLTEYDIKRAEARYNIALKEVALENSQSNKTSMKLVRNKQGNWAYQYVANQDEIASKQQDLLDSWNDLYQLASDAYEKNLNSSIELQKVYLEQSKELAELMMSQDVETRELAIKRKAELDEWYLIKSKEYAEDNAEFKQDLEIATVGVLKIAYDQDKINYESLTNEEKRLIDEVKDKHIKDYSEVETAVKTNLGNIDNKSKEVLSTARQDWNSLAQQIINNWKVDNGASVTNTVRNGYGQIISANAAYLVELLNLQAKSGEVFGENGIKGQLDKAAESAETLNSDTQTLSETITNELPAARKEVDKLRAAYEKATMAIIDTISAIEDYITKVGKIPKTKTTTITTVHKDVYQTSGSPSGGSSGGKSGGSSGGGAGGGTSKNNTGNNNTSSKKTMKEAKYSFARVSLPTGTSGVAYALIAPDQRTKIYTATGNNYETVRNALNKWFKTSGYEKTFSATGFNSGGYTGTWNNNDGRLAVLHQKELVLNKEDTKNFLEGINTIRDMTSLNSSISKTITDAISNIVSSLSEKTIEKIITPIKTEENPTSQNTFNITAEFPNAENVNEIRQAILSLPNIASQYAARNKK